MAVICPSRRARTLSRRPGSRRAWLVPEFVYRHLPPSPELWPGWVHVGPQSARSTAPVRCPTTHLSADRIWVWPGPLAPTDAAPAEHAAAELCMANLRQYRVRTVQYSARMVQYSVHTVQRSPCTMQHNVRTVQHSLRAVPCRTVPYPTVPVSSVQYSLVQYSAVQYSAVQCSTAQRSCGTEQRSYGAELRAHNAVQPSRRSVQRSCLKAPHSYDTVQRSFSTAAFVQYRTTFARFERYSTPFVQCRAKLATCLPNACCGRMRHGPPKPKNGAATLSSTHLN